MWMQRVSLVAVCALCWVGCGKQEGAGGTETSTAGATKSAQASSGGAQPGSAAQGGATAPAEPKKPERKPLRALLVGTWLYESVEMPGVPPAAKKQIDAEMKKSSVEFTDKKFTSYTNGKPFSSSDYEVVEEKGNDLTIKLTKSKKTEVYTFVDDDTLSSTDKELGKTVMKRKP